MKIYQLKIERATKTEVIIYDDETKKQVEAKARRAMRKGQQVTWMDGTKQWNDCCVLADADMREIYNPDNGDEIKVAIVLKTIAKDGTISETVLREEWMEATKAWSY
jgi:hypothetical protein